MNYLIRFKQQLIDDEWINNKQSSRASVFLISLLCSILACCHCCSWLHCAAKHHMHTCTPPNRAVISQCFCLSNGASMRCVESIVLQREVSYCVSSNWTRDFPHSSRYNVPECNSKQSTKENISHLPLFHLPPCFHLFSVIFFRLYKYDV